VHPDVTNTDIGAFADDAFRYIGSSDDHDSFDPAGYGFQIGITTISVERLQVGIHGEYVVPGTFEAAIDQVCRGVIPVVARDAGNGDPSQSQEIVDFRFE